MAGMTSQPEITQRDLRNRSREIMDAVERGQAFTVTRDGHRIGELVPLRQRRRFVSRAEFAAMSRTAPVIDADAFRADQHAAADQAGLPETGREMVTRTRASPCRQPEATLGATGMNNLPVLWTRLN